MGQTRDRLEPGDRCIIEVDDVNSPTGLWWGVVDEIKWKDDHHGGYGTVTAHITGPFQFGADQHDAKPNYGTDNTVPHVNYEVYAANRNTTYLFRRIQRLGAEHASTVRDLRTRLDELRGVVKSMGVSREMLAEVVRLATAR